MDPYIGERFEDKDPRNEGRVIQVLKHDGGLDGYTGHYVAEVKVHPKNPDAVGRKVRLSADTLDKRYRQVSH